MPIDAVRETVGNFFMAAVIKRPYLPMVEANDLLQELGPYLYFSSDNVAIMLF